MAEDSSNPLGQFLNIAQQFATPFAKTLAYGRDKDTESALTRERADMERLNGSGPTNPDLAVAQSSKSWFDFLYGNPATRGTESGQPGSMLPLIILGGLGLVLVFFMVRR